MKKDQVIIRPAKKTDSKRVWEIRNLPPVRILSNNQNEIDFRDHNVWFLDKYFSQKNNFCLVAEINGLVAGYSRLDEVDLKDFLVSIAVDTVFHGQGIGSRLLDKVIEYCPSDCSLLAEIKKTNQISLSLFLKKKFIVIKSKEDNFLLKLKK